MLKTQRTSFAVFTLPLGESRSQAWRGRIVFEKPLPLRGRVNGFGNFYLNASRTAFAALMVLSAFGFAVAEETVIDFESAEIGKPIPQWTEKDVVFDLAHAPTKSKAKGRVMFFPHLGTERKGILGAMADESIPVRVAFPRAVNQVKLVLWGSTTSSALVEAFDAEGKLVAKDALENVPVRKSPEERVPFFELAVSAERIAYLQISGSQPGGFLAIDELRWSFSENASALIPKPGR